MSTKRLLIDFDRVIHQYTDGWRGGDIYDAPIAGAFEAIRKLQDEGWEIVIFTTRSSHGDERNYKIQYWFESWGFNSQVQGLIDYVDDIELKKKQLLITNTKIHARAIIDDRAIRFTNWSDILRYFT